MSVLERAQNVVGALCFAAAIATGVYFLVMAPSPVDLQQDRIAKIIEFEHDCPRNMTKVVLLNMRAPTTATVEACGVTRKYRDVGDRSYVWVEVRDADRGAHPSKQGDATVAERQTRQVQNLVPERA